MKTTENQHQESGSLYESLVALVPSPVLMEILIFSVIKLRTKGDNDASEAVLCRNGSTLRRNRTNIHWRRRYWRRRRKTVERRRLCFTWNIIIIRRIVTLCFVCIIVKINCHWNHVIVWNVFPENACLLQLYFTTDEVVIVLQSICIRARGTSLNCTGW